MSTPLYAVTGATGFVGGHLIREMLTRGMAVRGLLRTTRALLADDALYSQAEHGDLDAQTDFRQALQGVDTVIHLAGRAHKLKDTAADPEAEFERINVDGTRALAQQAAALSVRRLVFVSTIKVNGEGRDTAYTPADAPAPRDAYGRSKLRAEEALRDIAAQTGLEVVIVRPPLVYGPGVGANFLRLLKAARARTPLPLGAVRNKRSFIGVYNFADVLLTAATHPDAPGNTFLVSDGHDVSTPELLRLAARAMGKEANLLRVPLFLLRLAGRLTGKGPQIRRITENLSVDISQTRSILGWTPPITMEAELERTVWHMKEANR